MPRTLDRPLPSRLDIRRILAECHHDPLLHSAATVLAYTGIRGGELTALTVRDYIPGARTIAVGTKRNPRTITIAPSAAAAIDACLAGEETEPDEQLLMGLRREWVYPLLREAADRAGAHTGVHELRRAAVGAAVDAGVGGREVAAYFGMSDPLPATGLVPLQEGWDGGVAAVLEAAYSPS